MRTTIAFVMLLAVATTAQVRPPAPPAACPAGRVLRLTNGRIHTMDAKRSVVQTVRLANGRIVDVGGSPGPGSGQGSAGDTCTDTLDLRGRTVIPGMIDLHSHAFQRALAGLTQRLGADEASFWTWRDRMYAFAGRITPDDLSVCHSLNGGLS